MRDVRFSPQLTWSLVAGAVVGVIAGAGAAVSQTSPPERGAAVLTPAVLTFGTVPVSGPPAVRSATLSARVGAL